MSETIVTPIPFGADLDKGLRKTYMETLMASGDNNAHRIDVHMFRGNAQLTLPSDASVSGYFIRYSDNATIALDGSASGSTASVTLKRACYNKPGAFAVIVKVTTSGVTNTVFYGEGTVLTSSTDTILDDENVVPSLEDLLAQIAAMERATSNANAATTAANTAASNANTKASAANTAANNANAAAAKINGMTVSAESAAAAGATVTEKNGVKHISFKLPTGATPQITFSVETGPAGSQVQLAQSGTAENPVIHLTIPRGDTGAVEGVDYYEGMPNALGKASTGTANGLSRGDHVHPMPSASDVGALPKDGTAVNASKLNGKTLTEINSDMESTYGAAMKQVTVLNSSREYSIGDTVEFNAEFPKCHAYYGRLKGNSTNIFYSVGTAGAITIISYAFPSTTTTAIRMVRMTGTPGAATRTVELIREIKFTASGTSMSNLESIEIGPIMGFRPVVTGGTGKEENLIVSNQVSAAVDTDGTAFNDGQGWIGGYRVRSSGELEASTYVAATGYIPVTAGDVIRFDIGENGNWEEASSGNCIHFADEAFAMVGAQTTQPAYYGICEQDAHRLTIEQLAENLYQFIVPEDKNICYMRMSVYGVTDGAHGADLVITRNEET